MRCASFAPGHRRRSVAASARDGTVCHPSRLGEGHHGGTGSDDAGNHPEFGWLTRVVRNRSAST